MNDRERAQIDEVMKDLLEKTQLVAPIGAELLRTYYLAAKKIGFTDEQAFEYALHGVKNTSVSF